MVVPTFDFCAFFLFLLVGFIFYFSFFEWVGEGEKEREGIESWGGREKESGRSWGAEKLKSNHFNFHLKTKSQFLLATSFSVSFNPTWRGSHCHFYWDNHMSYTFSLVNAISQNSAPPFKTQTIPWILNA